jgi:hypothetical protein
VTAAKNEWDPTFNTLKQLYDIVFNPQEAVYPLNNSKAKYTYQAQFLHYPNIPTYRTETIRLFQSFCKQVRAIFGAGQLVASSNSLPVISGLAQMMISRIQTVKNHYDQVYENFMEDKFSDNKSVLSELSALVNHTDYSTVRAAEDAVLNRELPT